MYKLIHTKRKYISSTFSCYGTSLVDQIHRIKQVFTKSPETKKFYEQYSSIFVDSIDQIVYIGQMRNNLAHGYGICCRLDSEKYDGEWWNGKPHGAVLEWTLPDSSTIDGLIYESDPTEGKQKAFFKRVLPTSAREHKTQIEGYFLGLEPFGYAHQQILVPQKTKTTSKQTEIHLEGFFKSLAEFDFGIRNEANKIRKTGFFKHGLLGGYGIIEDLKKGDVVIGEFKNNLLNGYGYFTHPVSKDEVEIWEGFWKDNVLEGFGTLLRESADQTESYVGQFSQGEFEGIGLLKDIQRKEQQISFEEYQSAQNLEDQDEELPKRKIQLNVTTVEHAGNFVKGKLEGNGSVKHATGLVMIEYLGAVKNNSPDGCGVLTIGKDFVFTGQVKDDRPNGFGILLDLQSKEQLVGFFTEDMELDKEKSADCIPQVQQAYQEAIQNAQEAQKVSLQAKDQKQQEKEHFKAINKDKIKSAINVKLKEFDRFKQEYQFLKQKSEERINILKQKRRGLSIGTEEPKKLDPSLNLRLVFAGHVVQLAEPIPHALIKGSLFEKGDFYPLDKSYFPLNVDLDEITKKQIESFFENNNRDMWNNLADIIVERGKDFDVTLLMYALKVIQQPESIPSNFSLEQKFTAYILESIKSLWKEKGQEFMESSESILMDAIFVDFCWMQYFLTGDALAIEKVVEKLVHFYELKKEFLECSAALSKCTHIIGSGYFAYLSIGDQIRRSERVLQIVTAIRQKEIIGSLDAAKTKIVHNLLDNLIVTRHLVLHLSENESKNE